MPQRTAVTRKHTVLIMALAVSLLIASCGDDGGKPEAGMKPTLTQQQATQRVDDYMRQILGVLPQAQLEDQEDEPMPCDDPTDNGPKGRVTVSKSYMLWGLPKEDNAKNIDKVRQWALTHNFGILNEHTKPATSVWLENEHDGFRAKIRESADESKVMTLIVASPCVWPNGTPQPKPQGQAAESGETPMAQPEASSQEFFFKPERFRSQ